VAILITIHGSIDIIKRLVFNNSQQSSIKEDTGKPSCGHATTPGKLPNQSWKQTPVLYGQLPRPCTVQQH